MKISWLISAVVALALTGGAVAQDSRTEVVKFKRGASSTSIDDRIKGYNGVTYVVGVSAGQRMSVQLDSDNTYNYFNITAPGASEALFNGSISGGSTSFVIPSSGDYKIDVYLMRNAARRGETANYELTIAVEGKAAASAPGKPAGGTRPPPSNQPPVAATDGVPVSLMPRYCTGEASAKFGVRPQDITTNAAFKSGKRYVSQGWFDGADGSTFFNCYFQQDGTFISVN